MSSVQRSRVSIVLPMYKPCGPWPDEFLQNVKEWNEYLSPYVQVDYIVVHDGLPDTYTINTFRSICVTHPEIQFNWYTRNRGKGYALRQGVRISTATNTLTMDFDFPYRKESTYEMIGLLQQGHDVIVGKRSNEYFKQIPFKRKAISKIFSWLSSAFLGLPLRDAQSGIKGFNQKGRSVFLETTINRFLVDTEFILRASKENLDMKTIQIEPKPCLYFTNFGFKVIRTESGNFFKLLRLSRSLTKKRPPYFHAN